MDRDPDRIDFRALDPSTDAARWESMIQATLARSRPLATVHPLFTSIASRGRVALALAAALAAIAWLPSLLRTNEPAGGASTDAATQLATWASRGDIPEGENMFEAFGVDHVNE